MIAAVFKVSYTALGEEWPAVTLIGTAFFVSPRIALTARHILPPSRYPPDDGYARCEYWLLGEDGSRIQFGPRHLTRARRVDAMRIDVAEPCVGAPCRVLAGATPMGDEYTARGYADPSAMSPAYSVRAQPWSRVEDVLRWFDLSALAHARRGVVRTMRTATVAAAEVRLSGVQVIEFAAGGVQGMSGGPLIHETSGRVAGILSFGLPNAGKVKDVVYAMPIAGAVAGLAATAADRKQPDRER